MLYRLNRCSKQERKDIEDGVRLLVMMGGNQDDIDALIAVSLLALGYDDKGQKSN